VRPAATDPAATPVGPPARRSYRQGHDYPFVSDPGGPRAAGHHRPARLWFTAVFVLAVLIAWIVSALLAFGAYIAATPYRIYAIEPFVIAATVVALVLLRRRPQRSQV
jgi:hypothetical protein